MEPSASATSSPSTPSSGTGLEQTATLETLASSATSLEPTTLLEQIVSSESRTTSLAAPCSETTTEVAQTMSLGATASLMPATSLGQATLLKPTTSSESTISSLAASSSRPIEQPIKLGAMASSSIVCSSRPLSSSFNENARKRWELENEIQMIPRSDLIFCYDYAEQKQFEQAKPWLYDHQYFNKVKMSAVALLKMMMHSRSGGNLEKMGLLFGKIEEHSLIVMESFAIPIENPENKISPQYDCLRFLSKHIKMARKVGRLEQIIGWYHSHPGYGCWLSGADVINQRENQIIVEPYVAIVVDPLQTVSAGKVCLGAFRTLPVGYEAPKQKISTYETIPSHKMKDFEEHCSQYYSLEVSYFKSELDAKILHSLWDKFWIETLSSSRFFSNLQYTTDQITDLTVKLKEIESDVIRSIYSESYEKRTETRFETVTQDCSRMSAQLIRDLVLELRKNAIFNKPVEYR